MSLLNKQEVYIISCNIYILKTSSLKINAIIQTTVINSLFTDILKDMKFKNIKPYHLKLIF